MINLSEEHKRDAFFYAQEEEAQFYDDIIELTLADYGQVHKTMVDLLRYHFCAWEAPSSSAVRGSILDAGCGTGAEGLATLAAFPHIRLVGVDFSPAMLTRFRETYEARFGTPINADRCVLVCRDLLAKGNVDTALRGLLLPNERSTGYRGVITAFALHHYDPAEKERVYRQFHSLLEPGGILLNADLFTYRQPDLARHARQDLENWILCQFADLEPRLSAKLASRGVRTLELRDSFLRHIREYNVPLPVEAFERGSLTDPPGEFDILRKVGFSNVGCPYRHFQSGILQAKK